MLDFQINSYHNFFQVFPPVSDRLRFRNRHGELSINALMLCDAFGVVDYCSANCPGSYHDQTVLEKSDIYQVYQVQRQLPFEGAMCIGDSAYKRSWDWLITPFLEGDCVGDPR